LTFLAVSRAWANDRYGAQSVILEGIARLFNEHGSKIDIDHLVDRLKTYKGGPRRLHAEAQQLKSSLGGKVAMHVSWIITEAYNKGKKEGATSALPSWRKRA
jgi:hypothetical protein